jgi:hypothetical protein
MVWNIYVRFGKHVDIQVSYKDLTLGTIKEGTNYAQSTLLLRNVVLRQLWTQQGYN